MIRANRVHSSGQHLMPQRLARLCVADRRRTLQRRADALEILLGEREIMGTRLRGDRHAFAACPVHLRQSLGTADVDDVRAHPLAGAAHANEQSADRGDLGGSRPGVVPVGIRWSRWLTVSEGACIRRGSTTTEVVVRQPGRLTVSSSYLAPFNGRHC